MDILALIARDPNVSQAYRRLVANPKNYRDTEAEKADQRRLLAEPHTPSAFGPLLCGPLNAERRAEIRAEERADELRDLQRERDGGAL